MGEHEDMILYRLDTIEKRLDKATEVLEKSVNKDALQDIKLQNHDEQLKEINKRDEERLQKLEERVAHLEREPITIKATRWQTIADYCFKALVTIGVGMLLFVVFSGGSAKWISF